MKSIAQNEADQYRIDYEAMDSIPLYSKQMWDSEVGRWVEFSLWGAHYIVNSRKEHVVLRIYRPLAIQPEFGPTLKAWQSLDSTYLNEQLKEKENPYESYEKNCRELEGNQAWKEIIRQDRLREF
jgi:hypothetical protein